MSTPSFLSHPFFVLAMSLRPPELPPNEREHPELAPTSPALLQTFELPEPEDTSLWPVCHKCEKPFSSELALRHHLASQFHRHTEVEKQSPSLLLEDEPIVVPKETAEAGLVCSQCSENRIFKSALALRMHMANGNHSRWDPEEVLPTWGKPQPVWQAPVWQAPVKVYTPPAVTDVGDDGDRRVEEALKRICVEIVATKRVTFSDSMLAEIATDMECTQILVLSATRDLALLVDALLAPRCASFGVTTYACVGGTAIQDDRISLEAGPHIVSGTPGRVCDMIRRGALLTDGIRLLVLNKEEMLLSRSMWPQLAKVYGLLDPETRVVRASVRVREGTS